MSAAAAFVFTPAGRPIVAWNRTPKALDHLTGRGFTRLDKEIWRLINQAIQIETREGQIAVPELAYYAECTERGVYKSLARLKAAGALEAESRPGRATIYRLPFEYVRPRQGHLSFGPARFATPERSVQGSPPVTPEQPFRGSPPVSNNARATTPDTPSTTETATARKPAQSEARPSVAVHETVHRCIDVDSECDRQQITTMPDPGEVGELVPEIAGELEARGFIPNRRILTLKLAGKSRDQAYVALREFDRIGRIKRGVVGVGLYVSILADAPAPLPSPPLPVVAIGSSYSDYCDRCRQSGETPVDIETWLIS